MCLQLLAFNLSLPIGEWKLTHGDNKGQCETRCQVLGDHISLQNNLQTSITLHNCIGYPLLSWLLSPYRICTSSLLSYFDTKLILIRLFHHEVNAVQLKMSIEFIVVWHFYLILPAIEMKSVSIYSACA